jgi:hypothetical protein
VNRCEVGGKGVAKRIGARAGSETGLEVRNLRALVDKKLKIRTRTREES